MPIDFRCENCGKLLRTPDDTAGKSARCTECGNLMTIPASSTAALDPPVVPAGPSNPFTDTSSTNPYSSPTPMSQQPQQFEGGRAGDDLARAKVVPPAIALMVYGILALIVVIVNAIYSLVIGIENAAFGPVPQDEAARIGQVVGFFVAVILTSIIFSTITIGAWKMKNMQSHGFAMAAAIMAMLPCSLCCPLGLGFGIWALVVLNDPAVKAAFR